MKRTRAIALTAALLVTSAPLGLATMGAGRAYAAGRTYFVNPSGNDSNAGRSTRSPFRTLQKAADSAGPGDTVSIMNGTYSERSEGSNVLTIKRSGLPGAPITFTAHPGHHPVIHPVKAWNGISVHGASYISVKNLEVKGNNDALTPARAERESKKGDPTFNTNCISVEQDRSTGAQSHHVEVTGNEVHGCAGGGISAIDSDHVTICVRPVPVPVTHHRDIVGVAQLAGLCHGAVVDGHALTREASDETRHAQPAPRRTAGWPRRPARPRP
ncbi:DUF1565 domain-containing protein [Streptomyces roseus]|uniref:DUF1565 domain-containing protein n=1 Tax=Streptomyces roseus TaxID=66430 RepID=UPI00368C3703